MSSDTVDVCPECYEREMLTSPLGGCRCGWNGLTGRPRVVLNATMYLIVKQAGYDMKDFIENSPLPTGGQS